MRMSRRRTCQCSHSLRCSQTTRPRSNSAPCTTGYRSSTRTRSSTCTSASCLQRPSRRSSSRRSSRFPTPSAWRSSPRSARTNRTTRRRASPRGRLWRCHTCRYARPQSSVLRRVARKRRYCWKSSGCRPDNPSDLRRRCNPRAPTSRRGAATRVRATSLLCSCGVDVDAEVERVDPTNVTMVCLSSGADRRHQSRCAYERACRVGRPSVGRSP